MGKELKNIQIDDLDDLDEMEMGEDFEDLDDLDDLKLPQKQNVAKPEPIATDEDEEKAFETDVVSERFFVRSAAYGFSANEVNSKVCDDSIMDVVVRKGYGHDDIDYVFQLYIYDYTTQAVIVNYMSDDSIEVQLPMLASEADVDLCYAYLSALKELQPDCSICSANGKVVDLSEDAMLAKYREHSAFLLKQWRQGATVEGINEPFTPSECDAVNAAANDEERIEAAWSAFLASQWGDED